MPCNNNPTLLVNAPVHSSVSVTPGSQHSQPITRQDQTSEDNWEGPEGGVFQARPGQNLHQLHESP